MTEQVVKDAVKIEPPLSRFGAPVTNDTETLFKAHAQSCTACRTTTEPCGAVARFMAASVSYFAQYTP